MTRVRWYQSFIAGGVAAILLAILFPACGEDRQQQLRSAPEGGRRQHLGFDIDIQREGPLLDGTRVTLLEAKNATPYRLAIPPVNRRTGELTGIWIDDMGQVAFVWDTDLRMYQSEPDSDVVEAELEDVWAEKVRTERATPWRLVEVAGDVALALDGGTDEDGRKVYSLTYMDKGLSLQFVSPSHDVGDLIGFAESVVYE